MPADLSPIHAALRAGDKRQAQTLLRPLLTDDASAEVWTLAAQACTAREQAMACLRRALAQDPYYLPADRLLLRLEGGRPAHIPDEPRQTVELTRAELKALKKPRRKPGVRGCVLLLLLSLFSASFTLLTLNLVGVISGVFTQLTVISGGPTPVVQIDGVPLALVEDAALVVTPSVVQSAQSRETSVLDPGYAHEYLFQASQGEEVAIYVQFLSVGARQVRRNVVILRPDGSNFTRRCDFNQILQGDNNVAYICRIDRSGEWKVKLLGRDGESVGAYFVGVERIVSG
jgi:hypothetical protein